MLIACFLCDLNFNPCVNIVSLHFIAFEVVATPGVALSLCSVFHASFILGTIMNNQHLSAMIKSSHDISWFIPDFWIQSSPLIVPSQALAMSTGLKKISISEHPNILWLKSLRNEQACLSCQMYLFTKFLEKTLGFHSRFTNSIVLLQIKESSNARSFTKT